MWRRFAARLAALWQWRRNESALDEEIQFHLAEEAAERERAGLDAAEARRAAERDFGNVLRIREKTRDAWGWSEAERLLQDVRHGLRSLRRQWGFSAVAASTLALGIGATAAVLSVVNALLIRPLPFDDAKQLVQVYATTPQRDIYRDTTSFRDFSEWKKAAALSNAAAFNGRFLILTGDGTPQLVWGLLASFELFDVLRVQPMPGRAFSPQEQHANAPVAVISHRVWVSRYGSDPRILGRTIVLDEVGHTIIGVMPAGFQFPAYTTPDVIIPILERPCRSCGYLRVVARMSPGAAVATAQQQLDLVAAGLARAFPDSNEGRGVWVVPLADVAVGAVRSPILLLLSASVLVLLIGCANVGNLILARGLARARELALRSALGAGAGRLVRQLLTESITLALIASMAGAALGGLGRRLLVVAFSDFPMPSIDFDWSLLSFTVVIALAAGLLSGVPLAVMVWRARLSDVLKDDGRGFAGVPERRVGSLLIVVETALTVMLLTTAALFTMEFVRFERIDVGLDPTRALAADLVLSKRNAEPARRQAYTQALVDSIGGLPGVGAVAAHVDPPFQNGGRRETFSIEGRPDPKPDSGHPAGFDIVSDRFFAAMDVGIVRGRAFDGRDSTGGQPVAIVNETAARAFWPEEEAVGKRVRFYYERQPQRWLTVVGVARDVRYRGRLSDPIPQVFVPGAQPFYKPQDPSVSLIIRTAGEPAPLIAAVRERIWSVDKDQPIVRVRPLETILSDFSRVSRAYAALLLVFATVALVIAGAGVYGLNAYTVTRRRREIGIRLALGATAGRVFALIVRQSMTVVAIGLALGVAGSIALGKVTMRFVGHFVTATNPVMLAAVMLLFAVVALVAALVPARRAMQVDPAIAFRDG